MDPRATGLAGFLRFQRLDSLLCDKSLRCAAAEFRKLQLFVIRFVPPLHVKMAIVGRNSSLFFAAVFIWRTSLSAASLTMAAGLSGCAIKGKLHRETGLSPFRGWRDHRTACWRDCTWSELVLLPDTDFLARVDVMLHTVSSLGRRRRGGFFSCLAASSVCL